MKYAPEKLIFTAIVTAFAAAAALGALAIYLSRHEEAFRKEELRNTLRAECRLLAEACSHELQSIRNRLEYRCKRVVPTPEGIRQAVGEEPFFANGFLANRDGQLLYATEKNWLHRFDELFTEIVRLEEPLAEELAPSVQQAVAARKMSLPTELVMSARSSNRAEMAEQDRSAVQPVKDSMYINRLLPRFAALTFNRQSGFIPYFSGNRFTPLVWAAHPEQPEYIVGFELEGILFWSYLVGLFPDSLPGYFRLELLDASDRLIHSAGGLTENGAEPVLVMPFSEQLLPNAQIRASLLPELLPLGSFRLGIWLGIAAPVMIILLAGILLFSLIRREMRLATQKTGFVSQVSHELKTPLTSIRMYSELLQQHGPELPEAKRERYLQILQEESERLSRLVGNVLDFSRLSERRKRYNPEETDLGELVMHSIELSRERAAAEGIALEFTPPETRIKAVTDRDSLLQVLYNLLDNAFKYAAVGEKVELSLHQTPYTVEIRIRDFGPGVPPEAVERIFRKFYRVDTALEAKVSGFGLGLAISRTMLRDQGGELRYGAASPGSFFIITLPKGSAHV